MPTPDHTVGDQIKHLRKQRGWSQEAVARGVGVGVLAVGKWERKEALPSRDNRIKLAELFEVDEAVMGVDAADGSAPPSWALALDAKLDAIIGLLEDLPR